MRKIKNSFFGKRFSAFLGGTFNIPAEWASSLVGNIKGKIFFLVHRQSG